MPPSFSFLQAFPYIPLSLFQIHGYFKVFITYICACVYTYITHFTHILQIILSKQISLYTITRIYVFSELTIKYWITPGVLFPRENYFSLIQGYLVAWATNSSFSYGWGFRAFTSSQNHIYQCPPCSGHLLAAMLVGLHVYESWHFYKAQS